jgi:hypothetical protein
MRIAIASSVNQAGFIDEFIKIWPKYKRISPQINYTEGSIDSHIKLLDSLIDEALKYKKDEYIIHEYSIIDGLCNIFMLGAYDQIPQSIINKSILLAKNALHFYDLILYIPVIMNENMPEDVQQLENFYSVINQNYIEGKEWLFEFSSPDGTSAMVEIFGTLPEKLQMVKLYLNESGNPYGSDSKDSLISLPTIEEQADIDRIIAQNKK